MPYRFAAQFFAEDGRRIERVALAPEWGPAIRWTHWEGVREGRLWAVTADPSGEVQPVWDGRAGEPVVAAFRVVVDTDDGDVSREIPTAYVRGLVEQAATELVEKGSLHAGDVCRYVVTAWPVVATVGREPRSHDLRVEEVVRPLPLVEASLAALIDGARVAAGAPDSGEIPVFVPRIVLDEALALACEARDLETGGVLVGRLCRDHAREGRPPSLFLEATAQIPALHARAEHARLVFTADTWAAVHAALALRRRDEVMLGWWHFHPDFCRLRGCPPERRARCDAAGPAFSAIDAHLHGACFRAGYHVGLLLSDSTARGLEWSMYGWRQGMVAPRGFHVLDDQREGAADVTRAAARS